MLLKKLPKKERNNILTPKKQTKSRLPLFVQTADSGHSAPTVFLIRCCFLSFFLFFISLFVCFFLSFFLSFLCFFLSCFFLLSASYYCFFTKKHKTYSNRKKKKIKVAPFCVDSGFGSLFSHRISDQMLLSFFLLFLCLFVSFFLSFFLCFFHFCFCFISFFLSLFV